MEISTKHQSVAYSTERDFALQMDQNDPLAELREQYHIPKTVDGDPFIYLCGNSLGLQPKGTRAAIEQELNDWAEFGVDGHFESKHPWYSYHEMFREPAARLVGAKPGEVVVMNTLTANLHLMMVSFYRPTRERYRILIEDGAFPSDLYAVRSQAAFHGHNPNDAVMLLRPRDGEDTMRTEDIEDILRQHGHGIALVMLGGVNYYTGQAFNMERITQAAHQQGCVVGFDLAHAAGNLQMRLHDWDVDFAVWCTYKYLNSGPGGTSGCFVHQRHAFAPELPRFAGWWGVEPKTRFEMDPNFIPQQGAAGWQLSNAQVLPMAAHKVALDLFDQVGMERLTAKSRLLTGYLEFLVDQIGDGRYTSITPRTEADRGCQLSIRARGDARRITEALKWQGVIADFRTPDVVRVAPVPMYNTFDEVWRFVEALARVKE